MKKIISKEINDNNNSFEKMISKIDNIEERNILRVINYCGQNFEYENEYFTINGKKFIPGIYCVDKDAYYVFDFIDRYKQQRELINQLVDKFKDELNFKWISLEQYERIINRFKDEILTLETEIEKEKANINNDKFKIKEKMISKMAKIKSSDSTFDVESVSDEAERNLLKIMNYCKRQFEYQCHSFELDNTVFIPNIFCLKNTTFYILNFIDYYRGMDKQKIINQFKEKYPEVKIKQISLKQYRKILHWFQDDILFESEKYKINFNLYKRRRIKCTYCGKKFFSKNKKDKYCSEECAKNANNKKTNRSTIRTFFSGYYMDIHHYVRSGWEHNIARILQVNQLDYDYEEHAFTLSNGSVYTPDFYVYADDTYYEVKGEIRTNTLAKYNMFREEYPDKRLIIIDSKIYKDLLEQFPNINFTKHVLASAYRPLLNSNNKYRHNKIEYKTWELDYRYYTNRRYIENNNFNFNKLLSFDEALNALNISDQKLRQLIIDGSVEYYIRNDSYYFSRQFILQFKKSIVTNRLKNVQSRYCLSQFQNVDLLLKDELISIEERNIMHVLKHLNINFQYENQELEYAKELTLLAKIFVPSENNYYFVMPAYTQAYKNRINELLRFNKNASIIIITQLIYESLIQIFKNKISEIVVDASIKKDVVKVNGIHTCPICGKVIASKRIKYCSNKCCSEAKRKYITKSCANCNKEFTLLKANNQYYDFCSDACVIEYKQKNSLLLRTENCKQCNKQFSYIFKGKNHLFCSRECAQLYTREKNKKTYICKHCGKEFFSLQSKPATFCSNSCKSKHMYASDKRNLNVPNINTKITPTSHYYMDIHHYVKNLQEHNIARVLQINKINYDYMPCQFITEDQSVLVPSFYVYVDQAYYVVANTVSIEKLQKQIQLLQKNIYIIDKNLYNDLTREYLIKDLANNHTALDTMYDDISSKLNNVTEYRYNQVKYENWELDYRYYTSRRYLSLNNSNDDENFDNYVVADDINKKVRYIQFNKDQYYVFKKDLNKKILKEQYNSQLLERHQNTLKTNLEQRVCECCGKLYMTNVANQKYCSFQCKVEANESNRIRRLHTVTCDNCGKSYVISYKVGKNKKQICRDCYQLLYNNTEVKRQQANQMLIGNLKHIKWKKNDDHVVFTNEAKDNFAKILEYLQNEYTYEDNFKFIDNDQFIYQYSFFRIKNQTLYFLYFAETSAIQLRFKQFQKENPNIKTKVINRIQYERILYWFRHKIQFKHDKYPLRYHLEHKCLMCGTLFRGTYSRIYCSQRCKEKAKNLKKK